MVLNPCTYCETLSQYDNIVCKTTAILDLMYMGAGQTIKGALDFLAINWRVS
jgi:hypothetical protein